MEEVLDSQLESQKIFSSVALSGITVTAPNANWSTKAVAETIFVQDKESNQIVLQENTYATKPTLEEQFLDDQDTRKIVYPELVYLTEKQDMQIDGTKSLSTTFKREPSGNIEREVIFVYKNKFYEISLNLPEANYKAVEGDIEKILSLIHLEP